MSDQVTALPFDRRGVRWTVVAKAVVLLAAPAMAAGGLWLNSRYASREDVRAVDIKADAVAAPVASLLEFRARQENVNERTQDKLDDMVKVVTALKAATDEQLKAQNQSTTRILDQLDRIERRAARSSVP